MVPMTALELAALVSELQGLSDDECDGFLTDLLEIVYPTKITQDN